MYVRTYVRTVRTYVRTDVRTHLVPYALGPPLLRPRVVPGGVGGRGWAGVGGGGAGAEGGRGIRRSKRKWPGGRRGPEAEEERGSIRHTYVRQ